MQDSSMKAGPENVSMTAGGMQDSSMSKATPHKRSRFKGQTAVNKKDWRRSSTVACEHDSSM